MLHKRDAGAWWVTEVTNTRTPSPIESIALPLTRPETVTFKPITDWIRPDY